MPKLPFFVGGSYALASIDAECQRAVNLYPEAVESKAGTNAATLVGTPGITTFAELPTLPVRGLWAGDGRLFVVSGSKLYEVFAGKSFVLRGDVGDDSVHSPARMFANGEQLFIVSAGRGYIDNGGGTVDTNGTAVTWKSRSGFDAWLSGPNFVINGLSYTVASVTDSTHLILTASAGVQANVSYTCPRQPNIGATAGTCDTHSQHVPHGGWETVCNWATGDQFDAGMVGAKILITAGGQTFTGTVTKFNTANQLVCSGHIGDYTGVPYNAATPLTATMGAYLDTFYLAQQPDSNQFRFSSPLDGTAWEGAEYSTKEGAPDRLLAMLADHEELYLFGSQTTEVWRCTGASPTPFQRDPGAVMQVGISAPPMGSQNRGGWSAVSLGNGVAWIGEDVRGRGIAWFAEGYIPQRISTHAIENAWAQYTTTQDAEGYVYEEAGHTFWVVTFPSGNATWVFDQTIGIWHERGWWNATQSRVDRQRQHCHAFAFGKHLVGDWENGKIYEQSLEILDDAGVPIHRMRTAPHISDELVRMFYAMFQLDMETGAIANPVMTLDWSDDGGHTWGTAIDTTAGAISQFRARVTWNRLGYARDRVFRVQSSAAIKHRWINAYILVTGGTS